jgi:hypothetical protein
VITFTRTSPGVLDPATETYSAPTVTTITGEGIVMSGDPVQFKALELVFGVDFVIGFTPTTYALRAYTSDFVLPGDTTVINGATVVVKKLLKVVAPDGYVVYARIAVGA